MMVTNSRKPKYSYLRRMMVLPLLGCVTFAFAFRAHRIEIKQQNEAVNKMLSALQQDSVQDVTTKNNAPNDTVHYRMITGYGEVIKIKNGDTLSAKKDTSYNFQPVKKTAAILVRDGAPLYIINGKPVSDREFQAVSPDEIKSVTILKDAAAKAIYGTRTGNGVVIITTKIKDTVRIVQGYKAHNENHLPDEIMNAFDMKKDNASQAIFISSERPKPIIFIDGKKSSYDEMKNISPASIKEMHVIKDAPGKYGDEGKNGVIEITTKDTLPQVVVVGFGSRNNAQNYTGEFSSVQEEPTFPGGVKEWSKYLKMTLKENVPVDNNAPPGQYAVTVSFLVDKDGDVSEVKAINAPNPDYGTAAEAERAIWRSGKWIPAKQNGRTVTYRQKQKIIFTVQSD